MIEVTESAVAELDAYFEDKEKAPIRIYLSGGCSGPRLALALDEPLETDESSEQNGYTFIVDKELYEAAKPIRIDKTYGGFVIESSLKETGGGCQGCASASGCGH